MSIPGGKKGWGTPGRTETAVSREDPWSAMLGGAVLQRWGKRPSPPAHSSPSQGKEGPWPHWGLKQAAVLCVPSWGPGQGMCHGNGPSASEERSETWPQRPSPAPLFFADRRKATSLEPPSGHLHHLPKASGTLSQSSLCREDQRGGQIWVLAKC